MLIRWDTFADLLHILANFEGHFIRFYMTGDKVSLKVCNYVLQVCNNDSRSAIVSHLIIKNVPPQSKKRKCCGFNIKLKTQT